MKFENRRQEQEYNMDAKRRAFALEQDNDSKLILFRSTNNFWKLGGLSALEYYHHICPRLGKDGVRILPDTDFVKKFKEGVVSIRGLKEWEKKLEEIGITFEKEDEGVRIYDLGYQILPEEAEAMREERKTLEERANRNVSPKVLDANIYADLKRIMRFVYEQYRAMDTPARDFIGQRTVEAARNLLLSYINLCHETAKPAPTYAKMESYIDTMMSDALIMLETHIWEPKKTVEYQDLLLEVRTLVRKEAKG